MGIEVNGSPPEAKAFQHACLLYTANLRPGYKELICLPLETLRELSIRRESIADLQDNDKRAMFLAFTVRVVGESHFAMEFDPRWNRSFPEDSDGFLDLGGSDHDITSIIVLFSYYQPNTRLWLIDRSLPSEQHTSENDVAAAKSDLEEKRVFYDMHSEYESLSSSHFTKAALEQPNSAAYFVYRLKCRHDRVVTEGGGRSRIFFSHDKVDQFLGVLVPRKVFP